MGYPFSFIYYFSIFFKWSYFIFSIVNKQKNRKNKVGPFKENGEIIDEGEGICEKLVLEFLSQFSKISGKINGNNFKDEEADDLNDIEITEEDIKKAIDNIDENTTAIMSGGGKF